MEVQPGNLSNATKAEVTDDGEPRACLGPETQRMRKGSQPNMQRGNNAICDSRKQHNGRQKNNGAN